MPNQPSRLERGSGYGYNIVSTTTSTDPMKGAVVAPSEVGAKSVFHRLHAFCRVT